MTESRESSSSAREPPTTAAHDRTPGSSTPPQHWWVTGIAVPFGVAMIGAVGGIWAGINSEKAANDVQAVRKYAEQLADVVQRAPCYWTVQVHQRSTMAPVRGAIVTAYSDEAKVNTSGETISDGSALIKIDCKLVQAQAKMPVTVSAPGFKTGTTGFDQPSFVSVVSPLKVEVDSLPSSVAGDGKGGGKP